MNISRQSKYEVNQTDRGKWSNGRYKVALNTLDKGQYVTRSVTESMPSNIVAVWPRVGFWSKEFTDFSLQHFAMDALAINEELIQFGTTGSG